MTIRNNVFQFVFSSFIFAAVGFVSSAQAAEFARMQSFGDSAVWQTKLPENATGVTLRVLYTPNDLEQDSYIDFCDFKSFEEIKYPFSDRLQDGVYSWELRLINDGIQLGYTGKEEGVIDKNGREIEIVGKSKDTEKRVYISNRGRDGIQTGSFRVIDGKIPELDEKEPESPNTKTAAK